MWRHLHQVDVHVQQTRMRFAACLLHLRDRLFQHLHRLSRVGALGGLAGRQIPERPRRPVHQRLCEQRANVWVIRECPIHLPHRVGIGVVPGIAVFGWRWRWTALCQRPNECLFNVGSIAHPGEGGLGRRMGSFERLGHVGVTERLPGLVVVGAECVGDAPIGHGAIRVNLRRLLKASDRFLVVKAIAPDQAAIEPQLSFRR